MLDPRFAAVNYYPDDYQPVSLAHYLNVLLRRGWLILACFFLSAVGAYIFSERTIPVYQATAQIVSNPLAARSAAFAGSDMGVVPVGNPVNYYSIILKSSHVIENVLNRPLSGGGKLIDQVKLRTDSVIPEKTLARTFLKGIAQLSSSSNVRDNNSWVYSATVLDLTVRWRDPQVAVDLANAFAEELIAYDRHIKSSAARQKRGLIEKQIESTENRLTNAEEKLRDFKIQNRLLYATESSGAIGGTRVGAPPELQLEKDRRDRDVKLQNDLYLTLTKELELAKIAENNEASTLTIIEKASLPLFRTGSSTGNTVLLGALVGLMLGVGLAFVVEYAAKADMESADNQELFGRLASFRSGARKVISILTLGLISAASSPNRREKKTSDTL